MPKYREDVFTTEFHTKKDIPAAPYGKAFCKGYGFNTYTDKN